MPTRQELLTAIKKAESNNDTKGATVLAGLLQKKIQTSQTTPFFPTSEPKKKEAGFFSSLYEQATVLGLADEATAFVANPTEENQRAFIEAGNSKYESAGGFDTENKISLRNWRALKETIGGSIGALLAPTVVGKIPFLGKKAAVATMGAQYDIQNLLRQANERERAVAEGRVPKEVSLTKATLAAIPQTAVDVLGIQALKPLFKIFPGLNSLVGEAGKVSIKETGKLLEDALATGAYKITAKGVVIGGAKGTAIEIPQEVFQSLAERWNAGLSLTDKDAQEEYKQAAIGATLLGAPMGAASAALGQSAIKTAAKDKLAGEVKAADALAQEEAKALQAEAAEKLVEDEALRAGAIEGRARAQSIIQQADQPAVVPVEEETEEEIFAQNDDDAPADIPPPAATPAEYTPSYNSFRGIPGVTHLFKTGRGSVYAQNDKNQTIRDRSGKGHKDATTGLQPSSGKTIYLTSEAIYRLGSILQDNRATQLVPTVDKSGNPIAQVVLMEDWSPYGKKLQKKGSILADAPYTLIPQVGLNPVEIYDSISPANQAAPGIHFGNKITEVLEVPQTPAATSATTATPVETTPQAAPIGEAVAPVGEAVAPVGEAVAPVGEAVAPVGEAVAPVGEAVAPVGEAVAPVGEAVAPVGEAVAPVGEAVAPVGEAVAPVGEAVAPVGEAVAPVGEAVAPVGEAVAPVGEAVAPVGEAVAPVEEKGATPDDTGRPPSKYPVQPAEGETIVANPELVPKSQLDRVRTIVNGDRDTTQEKLRITGDLTPIEIVEYDITQNKAGDTIHRVQYSDGGVTVVAFDKNSQNSGIDFNREYIPPVPPIEASKPLTVKAVEDIDAPLPKSVVTALNAGDLAGALKALGAAGKNKSIGFMARALLRAVGGTKVEVVVGLVDESGNPVAGLFDPITNTIKLDSKTGINSHAVLHEMTHASVSAVLANPSHPVTRQLTVLFNAVKDKLGTAYGAQNLDEFVAEAFTNKVFQQKLAMLLQPNEKISVWGKFVNTVTNFVRNLLGLPSKQQDIKTMDELHRAILSIMAPAPESRFAGELYMAPGDVNFEAVPPVNSPQARSFLEVTLRKGARIAKELVMHFTPLIPLEQIAKKYIPMATEISKTILEQDGYAKKIHDILSDTAASITKWAGDNKTKYKEFSDLVNNSTRGEVDARLTDKDAERKYKGDTDKLNLWETLRYEYLNKLDDVGRKLYGDTFNAYKEIRDEHFNVLKNKIQETAGVDASQADILAKNLEAKLMALGYIDPYVKLGRPDGKYFLTFNAIDPSTGRKELYFEIFTDEFVREKRFAELVADKENVDQASIERTTRGDNTDYKNRAPDTSFIKSVLKVLEDNKVNKEVEDDILALFLDSMPEKSYLKGLTKRTGTLGYVDVVSTLKQQAFASATHLSRLKYNTQFRRLKTKLAEYAATARYSPDADAIDLYAKKLKGHIDFALNPTVENWAKIASSIGFNYGLGFNASGFFVNLSAFGTLIHPYLAGKYAVGGTNYKKAYSDTTRAMGVGFSVFRNSGSFAAPDVNKYRVGIEHYDFSRADIPPGVKMFSALRERMEALGQFSRTNVEDELNLGTYGNALGGKLAKYIRASGWFMSQSERILRQTTAMATYQLELAKQLKIPVSELAAAFAAGKITPEMQLAAADEAVLITELVNSGVMAQTAAEFSKSWGGFGKVASLFRRYSVNTFSILLKLSRDSVYGTAEDKKMARQQLAGVFGNTAIIAGVGGTPLFGSLALLYDLFTDDDEDDFETLTRKMVSEKVYGGLASYLLGASVASRIGFSDFIFRETYVDKDSPYLWRLALQLGGPLVGMGSQFETSAKLIGRGEIRRGMEAAAPSFARNLLKAQRFYTEGPQTIAGDQVAPPIDVREAIMQGLGFAPSDYIQLLEQNAASSKLDRYASELRSEIYTRYYRARKENDVEALARIREEIEEYRAKFPGYPIRPRDLQASYKRRNRISKEKIAGLTVNKNLRSQIQEERDEWGEASSIWDDLFEDEEDTEE
jgi:hypothetical protein